MVTAVVVDAMVIEVSESLSEEDLMHHELQCDIQRLDLPLVQRNAEKLHHVHCCMVLVWVSMLVKLKTRFYPCRKYLLALATHGNLH